MDAFPWKETSMEVRGIERAARLGLSLAAFVAVPGAMAAESGSSAYQGSWLAQGSDCAEVYTSADKGTSFKRPVDLFAPAFTVSGTRLRTPQASCRIKSIRPSGDRLLLSLDCANAVAGNEVRVLMATLPDGSLKRYLNEQDTTGSSYQRCSR
jgi:hypothetical protein